MDLHEMNNDLAGFVARIERGRSLLLTHEGKPHAVLLHFEDYEELHERMEEFEELAVLHEALSSGDSFGGLRTTASMETIEDFLEGRG